MIASNSIAEPIRRVGVIGPGLMGLGIAQALAAAGVEVALCGRDEASAKAGHARLAASLARQGAKGRLDETATSAILARVTPATLSALADRQLVIESVDEARALKARVLASAERAAPGAVIASNTSGLAIAGLAQSLADPTRFLGLHFFSPAERMPLVEVVRGPETSAEAVDAALGLVRGMGKRPILVRDGPGFFATRVFAAYLDEAVALMQEGVAPEAIESASIRALGPLAMLDETGLALNLQQARQAREDGLPERFRRPLAEPALQALGVEGRRGRRDGGGFYDYFEDGSRVLWPGLAHLFPRASSQPNLDSLQQRLFAAEAREALRCLEEGIVNNADDADAASILGLGFPQARGGVLRAVEDMGLGAFVSACETLAGMHGERFAPSPWLKRLDARGEGLAPYRKGSAPT